jgi:hypothetical protein
MNKVFTRDTFIILAVLAFLGFGAIAFAYWGMGPGMMGPGMMAPGYGYGQHYGPQQYDGRQYQQSQKPLDRNQAQQEVENYLRAMGNPNLKLEKIEEKGNSYQVNIVSEDGSLVDKILVDKNTGWMRSSY